MNVWNIFVSWNSQYEKLWKIYLTFYLNLPTVGLSFLNRKTTETRKSLNFAPISKFSKQAPPQIKELCELIF